MKVRQACSYIVGIFNCGLKYLLYYPQVYRVIFCEFCWRLLWPSACAARRSRPQEYRHTTGSCQLGEDKDKTTPFHYCQYFQDIPGPPNTHTTNDSGQAGIQSSLVRKLATPLLRQLPCWAASSFLTKKARTWSFDNSGTIAGAIASRTSSGFKSYPTHKCGPPFSHSGAPHSVMSSTRISTLLGLQKVMQMRRLCLSFSIGWLHWARATLASLMRRQ